MTDSHSVNGIKTGGISTTGGLGREKDPQVSVDPRGISDLTCGLW